MGPPGPFFRLMADRLRVGLEGRGCGYFFGGGLASATPLMAVVEVITDRLQRRAAEQCWWQVCRGHFPLE